jgi:hypothetical protein
MTSPHNKCASPAPVVENVSEAAIIDIIKQSIAFYSHLPELAAKELKGDGKIRPSISAEGKCTNKGIILKILHFLYFLG